MRNNDVVIGNRFPRWLIEDELLRVVVVFKHRRYNDFCQAGMGQDERRRRRRRRSTDGIVISPSDDGFYSNVSRVIFGEPQA